MKNIFLCIFLIGLFAFGCTSPPDYGPKQLNSKIELTKAVDHFQITEAVDHFQVPVIFAVYEMVLPAPDKPVIVMWTEQYGELTLKPPALKIKSTRISSKAIDNYQLKTFYVADKSKDAGTLSIRDKL